MRLTWVIVTIGLAGGLLSAQNLGEEGWRLERSGEAAQAHDLLRKAASTATDPGTLRAYAEFLDRHRDPAAREAYAKLDQALARGAASPTERAEVARRLALLDLMQGDRPTASQHLRDFHSAGGNGLTLPQEAAAAALPYIEIPGPIRSFSRMAGLSPDIAPADFLVALAHNVIINGYQAVTANEALDQTEYLKLVIRYLTQARELEKLAGPDKMVKVPTCDSAETGNVLRVLGYRIRGACGSDVVLETVNASRAFLTVDSGFPLAELELALRTNRPFSIDYHPARIPVMYAVDYWQSPKEKANSDFIDTFLADPSLCRLYLGLSKLDPETSEEMRKAMPASRLRIYAHVLDFYGAMLQIRGGRAIVPGGARSEKAWTELVGVAPDKGAAFVERLLAKEDGWLASYMDALARLNGPTKDYLCEPERLKRFYGALRGRVTSPGPARPVFRSNTDMMMLTTRLRLDANGTAHLPGGIDLWKNLFVSRPRGKSDPKLAKAAPGWKDGDDVIEAMFGLSRKTTENDLLKLYMALTDVDRNREAPLDAATADRLAREYNSYGSQYSLFAEFPFLSGPTIVSYLDTAHGIEEIHDTPLHADAAGSLQSLIGLWQILVRQGSIADKDADALLASILPPFAKVQNQRDVFDGSRGGIMAILRTAKAPENLSVHDRVMDLLAGVTLNPSSVAHQQLLDDMSRIFQAQRLISLSTIFELASLMEGSDGQKFNMVAAQKLAARITEINLPRNAFSSREGGSASFGYWSDVHVDQQRKLNLRNAIEKAAADPVKLKDLRGLLAPMLRDTLVGFNYIYFAPPGAQVLRTNPLFVRSHDFMGVNNSHQTWKVTQVVGSGWPANAGGRLSGSLISLPYALAEAEQNFLVPSREQALIWGDLVPQMIMGSVVPRWWTVKPVQLHWIGMNMSYAENLLAESGLSEPARKRVIGTLEHYIPPARLAKLETLLAAGNPRDAADLVLPSELYLLALDQVPNDHSTRLADDIRRLVAESPEDLSPSRISRAFGTPKPNLANSYRPELLNLRTFPTLMGYSSRVLAESWESNLLYYAALADEMHIQPGELNILIPVWTQQTVERIFATNLEDWPALLRSLRLVGDDVRQKARKQQLAAAN